MAGEGHTFSTMENKVQLITYADRFGKTDIAGLHTFLKEELADVIEGGVHLLPFFYPVDGADAGYDPYDNRIIDHRLGDWSQVAALSADFDVVADLIINHISDQSDEFQDVLKKGTASEYFDLFLTREKVFGPEPDPLEVARIFRPQPQSPFSLRRLETGEEVAFWTTFSRQQMDIDVFSPKGAEYIQSVLETFAGNGIRHIRLDAVGFSVKKAGTSCFMIPETYDFIREVVAQAHAYGIEVLAEVHANYEIQLAAAACVDYVYDFSLPPLVLYGLAAKDFGPLKKWLTMSPGNCVTVLDTHDGIGIMDVAADAAHPGLLDEAQIEQVIRSIHHNSGGQSLEASGTNAGNLDVYQVNCTFYDALGRDDLTYLMARAIQFFSPGIPQVYYAGLLASENAMELLKLTRVGRDINRPLIDRAEARDAFQKPVVKKLLDLIRLRNRHAAFAGTMKLPTCPGHQLLISWEHAAHQAKLEIDLMAGTMRIAYSEASEIKTLYYD